MLFELRKSLAAAIVIAMLALLMLSACGGGDDDDDSPVNGGNDPTATEASGSDGGDDDDGEDPTDDASGDDDGDDSGDDDGEEPTDNFGFDEDPSELAEVACTLLTPEEIGNEAGFAVGEGEPSSIEGFADCRWESADSIDAVSISLIAEGGEALFDFNNDDYEEIDGIGDRAQYSGGEFLPLLEVMEDDIYFSITVNGTELDEEGTREAILDLGRIAVDRLP